jgi:type I restriction enzyme S subunit
MNDDMQGALPPGWMVTDLDHIAEMVRGVSYPKSEASDTPVDGKLPILRATNIQDTILILDHDLVYVPAHRIDEEQYLMLGDIVVCMSSGSKHLVGKAAQLSSEWHGSFGTFCAVARPNKEIEPKYLGYYLQSPNYREFIRKQSSGININNLRQSDIAKLEIPTAPLNEQCRIVAKLEELLTRLDAGVAALKRAQANLKRYKASVLKAACEGKLVPTEAELACAERRTYEPADELLKRILAERRAKWEADLRAKGKDPSKVKYVEPQPPDTSGLPELPEGWYWVRAEQICDFITKGTTPSATKMINGGKGEIPYIKVYNLTYGGSLDFTINPTFIARKTHLAELNRSRVYPGDVLMNIVGPPLGKVSIVPDIYPEWNINQAVAIFRTITGYDRGFLSMCLQNEDILVWAKRRAKATAGQFNLTLEICRDLPVPLAPIAEQRRIVAEAERRLSLISKVDMTINTNLARAERLRQSILRRAFSGKLVPRDLSDEPAGALLERIRNTSAPQPEPQQLALMSDDTTKPSYRARRRKT